MSDYTTEKKLIFKNFTLDDLAHLPVFESVVADFPEYLPPTEIACINLGTKIVVSFVLGISKIDYGKMIRHSLMISERLDQETEMMHRDWIKHDEISDITGYLPLKKF
ncbi:MAG TPA: hypothetical protein VJC39_05030 [Candidatus Nanoarchaeia archaeon]|nr:hypothetical protein [Candidatus Nanoarchaeia archaeon]